MRRVLSATALLVLVGLVTIGGLMLWPIGHASGILVDGDAQRGAYLARAAGCIACHTDTRNGGAPLAGGVGLVTPFGTVHAPNLTTDPTHGIGAWTVDDFASAVRQGVSPDGQPYYPAFPYPFYATLTDQDIADLWAAFQTVPPDATPSKPSEMAFPFDQRWGLKLWRALFLSPPRTAPETGRDAVWNRGRFLVEGPGHCGACHTPRNIAGARRLGQRLQGNPALPGGGKAPGIDRASLAARGWDADGLAFALQTGLSVDGDAFGGSMAEVVSQDTAYLTQEDRRAIAVYLLDGPQ